MTQLNQVVAILKGVRSAADKVLTAGYQSLSKPATTQGLTRSYVPTRDGDVIYPPEAKYPQLLAERVLADQAREWSRMVDVTLTVDVGNTVAKADVEVDGRTLVRDAPVPFLLFLEKQLQDVITTYSKLPVLDAGEVWDLDLNTGFYRTSPIQTVKTKKEQRPIVLFPATIEHPAQTQLITEDIVEGVWTTTKFSGAIPASRRDLLVARAQALLAAVKQARERANTQEVTDLRVGADIFDYLIAADPVAQPVVRPDAVAPTADPAQDGVQ